MYDSDGLYKYFILFVLPPHPVTDSDNDRETSDQDESSNSQDSTIPRVSVRNVTDDMSRHMDGKDNSGYRNKGRL